MEPRIDLATGEQAETLVQQVRERYGRIAAGREGSCCGGGGESACGPAEGAVARGLGYRDRDLAQVPAGANLGLGCGAPIAFLALQPGETVLDLGSGAGLDVFLAAREVGQAGHAIGVDMTPEMLARARRNAAELGLPQVEFREGRLEALPVADATVDAVTSNCVINLVPDKRAVFAEVARVLRPGGRLVISDIMLDRPLPPAVEKDVYAYTGCVAGAALRDEYFGMLRASGLGDIEVLRDVDSLCGLAESAPDQAREFEDRTGTKVDDLRGAVRSVTYRAQRSSS